MLDGNADLRSLNGAVLQLRGDTVTVGAGQSGGEVQMAGDLGVIARGDIAIHSSIRESQAATITVSSASGDVSMDAGVNLISSGGDVTISGHSLSIATINARAQDVISGGVVELKSVGGSITDANANDSPDIFAVALNFIGYGPEVGNGQYVLSAVVDLVQVSAPEGLVVNDPGVDGRNRFNVMQGGKLYQQVVTESRATRVTEDPSELLKKDQQAQMAAGLTSASLPSAHRTMASRVFEQSGPTSANSGVSQYLSTASTQSLLEGSVMLSTQRSGLSPDEDLLDDNSYGLAARLDQSYVLGTPGEQPFVSGLATFSQDTFEYWIDTVSL